MMSCERLKLKWFIVVGEKMCEVSSTVTYAGRGRPPGTIPRLLPWNASRMSHSS